MDLTKAIYINLWLVLFFGALSIIGIIITGLRTINSGSSNVIRLFCFLLLLSDLGLITNAMLIRRDEKN